MPYSYVITMHCVIYLAIISRYAQNQKSRKSHACAVQTEHAVSLCLRLRAHTLADARPGMRGCDSQNVLPSLPMKLPKHFCWWLETCRRFV